MEFKKEIKLLINKFYQEHILPIRIKNKPRIFCIGRNKTGTTSLKKALSEFGYIIGDQVKAELLMKEYKNYNWKPILEYCKTAEAFQDVPFSSPYTWLILHEHFPNAKFILTYREPEKWYKSITSFHSKLFTESIRTPIKKDLQEAEYRYKGFVWEINRAVYKTPENDIYNKEELIENYNAHNYSVMHYFKDNPNFLAIDVSEKNSYQQLALFLGKKPIHDSFPHLNRTSSPLLKQDNQGD